MKFLCKRITFGLVFLAFCAGFSLSHASSQSSDINVNLGGTGFDMEFDAMRNQIYVSVPETNEIVILSSENYEVIRRVAVGSSPHGIDLSINGQKLFIALNQTGAVSVLDLNSYEVELIDIQGKLGDYRTWDIIEAKPNRLFVSANPGSNGLSWIVLVKLDNDNETTRVASNRIIRARPVFEVSADMNFLYVGSGFSPNSLYKLDLQQEDAPIILEDQHGSVSGTDKLSLDTTGEHIILASGQVLETNSFHQVGIVGNTPNTGYCTFGNCSVPKYAGETNQIYMLYPPNNIENYNPDTFIKTGDVELPCSFNKVSQLKILTNDKGWIGLGDDLICGVLNNPIETHELTSVRVSIKFADHQEADRFSFVAKFERDEQNDVFDPTVEDVNIAFGPYSETIPAGSFQCNRNRCWYHSDGSGITTAIIRANSVYFRGEQLNLSGLTNYIQISVKIGDNKGVAETWLTGYLRSVRTY